jgi:hypothetical protein
VILSLLVPVFDARESNLNSSVDFENLSDTFPNFDREISVGLCIAVSHSMTSYSEEKGGKNDTNLNLGTNILFVIIFWHSRILNVILFFEAINFRLPAVCIV